MNFLKTVALVTLGLQARFAGAEVLYYNPVIAGDHPDPSIIRVGKDYWATCTSSAWGPLFPLLHSIDLVNWAQTGGVLTQRPDWATGDFWAPEISEFNGKFFVYYTARQRDGRLAVAVATADKPSGPYTDHGPLIAQPAGSIDPMPFTDTNGVRYLLWKEDGNSQGKPTPIWAQRLNDDGTKLIGEPKEIIRNNVRWEGGVVEGPFVLRRGAWFYLFYSGNGCCGSGCTYALGVARSHSLLGPWEKNPANPILDGNATWKCPGHGSIVTDESGRCWFLYHAYSTTGSVFVGREALLDEVTFGAAGWPVINGGQGPSVAAVSPFGVAQRKAETSFTANFSEKKLRADWQWPPSRQPDFYLQNGKLRLAAHGRPTNFLTAVLARSTTATDYSATTVVETKSLRPGGNAGLCVLGDMDNAVGLAVSSEKTIMWRRERGTVRQVLAQERPAGEKIFLRLTVRQGFRIQFSASSHGVKWISLVEPSEAKELPPWDRSVRVALTAGGAPEAVGVFESFVIAPLDRGAER